MDALVDYSGYTRDQLVELLKIENIVKLPLKVSYVQERHMNGNGKETSTTWRGYGITNADSPHTITINKTWVKGLEGVYLNSTQNGTSFVLAVTFFT
ncbi:hypothetical protein [Chryseobacterium indoltheticum]|uniref:hypothetical protein n=1 Tax=Chryseobacterium indoltheticum TaxID=254 RepID=UPI003F4999F1